MFHYAKIIVFIKKNIFGLKNKKIAKFTYWLVIFENDLILIVLYVSKSHPQSSHKIGITRSTTLLKYKVFNRYPSVKIHNIVEYCIKYD